MEEISDSSWNSMETLTTVKNYPPKQSEILTTSETNQKIMQRAIVIWENLGEPFLPSSVKIFMFLAIISPHSIGCSF
jgi:hypothetical protein